MKAICLLVPGATTPILFSEYSGDEEEDSGELDEEEEDMESEEIFNESVVGTDTNGDISRTLPQPTKDFMNPLTVECDPVSKFRW